MPCEGAIIFRDIVGKLDVLNVECEVGITSIGRSNTTASTPSYSTGPMRSRPTARASGPGICTTGAARDALTCRSLYGRVFVKGSERLQRTFSLQPLGARGLAGVLRRQVPPFMSMAA
jgi:hypothetical protein